MESRDGRGIGVQREMVRSVLERSPFVADYRDAPAVSSLNSGGDIARGQVGFVSHFAMIVPV